MAGVAGLGSIATGLAFFAIVGVLTSLFELPFDLYGTFVIEERHGFNRQTPRGFAIDIVKGVALAVALGGPVLAAVLWIMERMGPTWWLCMPATLWATWAAILSVSRWVPLVWPISIGSPFILIRHRGHAD